MAQLFLLTTTNVGAASNQLYPLHLHTMGLKPKLNSCVFQMKMIDPSLLTAEEVDYLNNYHDRCRQEVGPLLREMNLNDGLSWLIKETEPLG